MAGGDKRGPDGRGPMTGRGLGYCAGYGRPGYEFDAAPAGRGGGMGRGYGRGRGFGGGFGRGRGFGYGRGHGYGFGNLSREPVHDPADAIPPTLADEIAGLRRQLQALEDKLSNTNEEI